jgi:AcrR family transcriptional regulator
MARTVNEAVHADRREAFIDAAQGLIVAKGYARMSIQDVLDATDASRGAFYHYFDSKEDLLEAVIERMADAALATIEPMVADPDLSAIDKFEGVFHGLAQFKAERKDLVLAMLDVWLSDHNAVVRERFRRSVTVRLRPLLARIIRQGRDEGRFTVSQPEEAARVVVALIHGANEAALDLFVARQSGEITVDGVERRLSTYSEALERILGSSPGALPLSDRATLELWYG